MTKRDFLKDVEHEIRMLKEHATPAELERLDFDSFNPVSQSRCIYGQMTTHCESRRAEELMNAACIRVMDCSGATQLEDKSFTTIKKLKLINGKYEGQTWRRSSTRYQYLSALEGYILMKDAKTDHIIDFLKDTTGKVKLNLVD